MRIYWMVISFIFFNRRGLGIIIHAIAGVRRVSSCTP